MLLPQYYSSARAYHELEEEAQQLENRIMEAMEEWSVLSEELSE